MNVAPTSTGTGFPLVALAAACSAIRQSSIRSTATPIPSTDRPATIVTSTSRIRELRTPMIIHAMIRAMAGAAHRKYLATSTVELIHLPRPRP